MNIYGNLNNLYLQISRTNKYSNDTLFGRRETEYSSLIKLTSPNSRLSSALQRPYSSTIKVSMFNHHKRNKVKLSKKKTIFSKGHPKSALKNLFHEENYFYKNSKTNNNSRFKKELFKKKDGIIFIKNKIPLLKEKMQNNKNNK